MNYRAAYLQKWPVEASSTPASHGKFVPWDEMQLSAQMCLLFPAHYNGYCYYHSEDLKNIQKTNLEVIDFVAPKTPKPRNWKQAMVIYIRSTPRKDICSFILKGFLATSGVWGRAVCIPPSSVHWRRDQACGCCSNGFNRKIHCI